jgi:hypothetical protein
MRCLNCGKELSTGDAPNSAFCRQCQDIGTSKHSMSFVAGCAGCAREYGGGAICSHCTRNPIHKDMWTQRCRGWISYDFHTTPPSVTTVRELASPTGSGCYAPEHHGRCCCNCRYHLRDHSHPLTDGGRITAQRGWLCSPPELDAAFSGWSEHGMCEMHDSPNHERGCSPSGGQGETP